MNNFHINLCSIDPVDYTIANILTPYFSICDIDYADYTSKTYFIFYLSM